MGTWGSKIEENDTYADVYQTFFDLYNSGETASNASKLTLDSMEDYFNDADDSNSAWFALAVAQWETNSLESEVFDKVAEIVSSGADIRLWRSLSADETDIRERTEYLTELIQRISVPRKTAKRRVKKKIDYSENRIVEIVSPDGKKTLTVSDEYVDGDYIQTTAMVMWSSGGGSVFNYKSEGAKVGAVWDTANILTVTVPESIHFQQADRSTFYYGETVTINYELVK